MNALSDFMGMMLLPSPPSLAIDMSDAVLTTAYLQFGGDKDFVFCVESEFVHETNPTRSCADSSCCFPTRVAARDPQGGPRRVIMLIPSAPLTSERDRDVLRSFARRIDPSDAGAHNNLGVLYYNKGLYEEAVAAFMKALELDPKMQVAQRNLEIAYFNTGYYDTRVPELQERLRLRPDDRDARWELGRTFSLLGQQDEAAEEFRALLQYTPNDVGALLQLALAEKAGRRHRARAGVPRARARARSRQLAAARSRSARCCTIAG